MKQINLRQTAICGVVTFAIGFIFAVSETIYFGSNNLPESIAELACDMIATSLWAIGSFLFLGSFIIASTDKAKQEIKDLKNSSKTQSCTETGMHSFIHTNPPICARCGHTEKSISNSA